MGDSEGESERGERWMEEEGFRVLFLLYEMHCMLVYQVMFVHKAKPFQRSE